MYPCAKLKLDQLFLQWLSLPDSQALVGDHVNAIAQDPSALCLSCMRMRLVACAT